MVTVYFRSPPPVPRRRCSRAAATGSTFKGPTLPVPRRSAHVCACCRAANNRTAEFFLQLPHWRKKPGSPQEIFRIRVLKSPLTGALLQQYLPPFWRVERTRGGGATDCEESKEEPDFFFVRMGGRERMKRKEEEEE